MTVAEKLTTIAAQQALLNALVLGLLLASFFVYARLFRRLHDQGCRVRHDLFTLPEALSASTLLVLFALGVALHFLSGAKDPAVVPITPGPRMIVKSMLGVALPAIALLLVLLLRGGRIREVFGLEKVPVLRALLLALGLTLAAMPLVFVAKTITLSLAGTSEPPQLLVRTFHDAITARNFRLLATIGASATLVAPFCEEVIFRGSFYPVLTRLLGRAPAALFCALLFGAVHDTLSDIPSLAVLALCLTAAYERTGSLLVPVFMHAWFNAISLLAMIWLPLP